MCAPEFYYAVKGKGQPRLEQNTLQNHSNSDILYSGSAGGTSMSNTCEENSCDGIRVSCRTQPKLESNILCNNKEYGIDIDPNYGQPNKSPNLSIGHNTINGNKKGNIYQYNG